MRSETVCANFPATLKFRPLMSPTSRLVHLRRMPRFDHNSLPRGNTQTDMITIDAQPRPFTKRPQPIRMPIPAQLQPYNIIRFFSEPYFSAFSANRTSRAAMYLSRYSWTSSSEGSSTFGTCQRNRTCSFTPSQEHVLENVSISLELHSS